MARPHSKRIQQVLPSKEVLLSVDLNKPSMEEKKSGVGWVYFKRNSMGHVSKRISDIYDDKDATLALKLDSIQTESKIFFFNKPILFQINKEGSGFMIENEQLDLFAAGKTREEAKVELSNQFEHSFQWFNELKDEELSSELLKVKVYYNLIVKQTIDK